MMTSYKDPVTGQKWTERARIATVNRSNIVVEQCPEDGNWRFVRETPTAFDDDRVVIQERPAGLGFISVMMGAVAAVIKDLEAAGEDASYFRPDGA